MNHKILTTAIVIAAIIALTPTTTVNLKATTVGPPPESEQATEQVLRLNIPSGERERVIESNEHSAQASNRIERSFDIEVDSENREDDEPAHESTRTVERGEETTTSEQTSDESSEVAAGNNVNLQFQENTGNNAAGQQ